MKIQVTIFVAVFISILSAAGLLAVATHTGDGLDEAYSLLPGIPTDESPFADFINSTGDSAQYPPDHDVISLKPYITRIDYTDHNLIDEAQALGIAWTFLEAVLVPYDYENIYYSCSEHFGILPRWSFEFLNATQEYPKSAVAYVGVNSVTGDIVSYTGTLPASVKDFMIDFNETEIARTIFDTFNTSIPPNSRYEQSTDNNEQYFFIFSQVVGPVLIHSAIGSLYLEIDTRFGGICYYGVDWVPFSEIPIENVLYPNSVGYEPRSLMLIPTPYDGNNGLAGLDFRLCWWLNNANYPGNVRGGDMIIDAFSGEIIQFIYYNYNPNTLIVPFIPLLIPSSGIAFAFVTYLIAKRKITTEPMPK